MNIIEIFGIFQSSMSHLSPLLLNVLDKFDGITIKSIWIKK